MTKKLQEKTDWEMLRELADYCYSIQPINGWKKVTDELMVYSSEITYVAIKYKKQGIIQEITVIKDSVYNLETFSPHLSAEYPTKEDVIKAVKEMDIEGFCQNVYDEIKKSGLKPKTEEEKKQEKIKELEEELAKLKQ